MPFTPPPQVPNYNPGNGSRLVTDRYDFEAHLEGTNPPVANAPLQNFRHTAPQIDLSPHLTIDSVTVTNVQDALALLASIVSPPTIQQATIGNNPANLGIVTLGGDLSGNGTNSTALSPLVGGLQGRPVSPLAPTSGQALIWNGSSWYPTNVPGAPSGAAGGDLSASYPNPTVARINGVSITNAPTTGQVLTAGSATTASWQTGGTITLSGDVTGGSSSNSVVSITGSSGTVNISASGAALTWAATATAPILTQANNTTASATAQNLTIQAQSATGSTSIGGSLNLVAGSGTSIDGYVNIKIGSDNIETWLEELGTPASQITTGIKNTVGYLSTTASSSNQSTNASLIVATAPASGHGYLVDVRYYGKVLIGGTDGYTIWGRNTISYKNSPGFGINTNFNTADPGQGPYGDTTVNMGTVTLAMDVSNNLTINISTVALNTAADWKFDITIIEN
jgi:hypothetical protein